MSAKQQALLLIPPLFPDEYSIEQEVFPGIPCSRCHGNGWFWGTDERMESVKKDCPVCKGNKRLKAVVTVQWVADEKEMNELK